MKTCEFCRYWVAWPEKDQNPESNVTAGDCRKHAPSLCVRARDDKSYTKWPSTKDTDFCGSFRFMPTDETGQEETTE
jgi:hypothetical protein